MKETNEKNTAVVLTSKLPRELLERAYREIQAKKVSSKKGAPA